MLKKLERVLSGFALPRLALWLVIGQVAVYLFWVLGRLDLAEVALYPALLRAGEVWRVVTFFFIPPPSHPVFLAFAWYMFFLMGNSLEGHWGAFRFNLFIFVGAALTIVAGFLHPLDPVSNAFLAGSVFLAFAYLNPEFRVAIFFIIPVRIKWLALLTWVGYLFLAVRGDWATRLEILAATGNFFLFFGRDLLLLMRSRGRTMSVEAERFATASAPRHQCFVCEKNSNTHPELDFRYCSKCSGDQCYCPEHISSHTHVTGP